MKDRSDNPSHHERTLLPRSYISLLALQRQFRRAQGLCDSTLDPSLHRAEFLYFLLQNLRGVVIWLWVTQMTEETCSKHNGLLFVISRSGQVRSECLTCTFRASCCSARLSRAQVPPFAGSSVQDRKKGGGNTGGYKLL